MRPDALSQRVHRDERFDLADELAVPTEPQVRLDSLLEAGEPHLLEPPDLDLRPVLVDEVCEGRSAKESERFGECPRRCVRVSPVQCFASAPQTRLQPEEVEVVVTCRKSISSRLRNDDFERMVGVEDLPRVA